MFHKILIANRGEIAVRVIRACQELGLKTVAVFSEADAAARHVGLADEAICLGPPPAAESYLRGERIVAAAEATGCDAIHPGYGFLAENGDFVAAVQAAGLSFIGPDVDTVRLMGSKTAARSAMQAAGVPVVPGVHVDNVAEMVAAAERLGYPVLIKAAAGGGGKGMRLAESPEMLPEAAAAARREARHAFGNGQLYLEKYISNPRHIEFQIFGDSQGQIIHLFERECSIQRRHQKIIEETPSPFLDVELRRRMGAAAVQAARAAKYVNAGTVEFLVDANRDFYFLEMNTRLQVEHPITELVTGLDLVKWQIRVAAGEALPFGPESQLTTEAQRSIVSPRGHALECRLYAEDPANDFYPESGRVLCYVEPGGPGIRVDSGIMLGSDVSVHYDPLLAKISVLGENRQEAIAKMVAALRQMVILGLPTNQPFLQDILAHPVFLRGETTTAFIREYFDRWGKTDDQSPDVVFIAAALAERLMPATNNSLTAAADEDAFTPWAQPNGFRIGGSNCQLIMDN